MMAICEMLRSNQVGSGRVGSVGSARSGPLSGPVSQCMSCQSVGLSVSPCQSVGQFISQCQSVINISQSDSYVSQSVRQWLSVRQFWLSVRQFWLSVRQFRQWKSFCRSVSVIRSVSQ